MVLVVLSGIASKTRVLSPILKGDVQQQDGDVIMMVFPHKLHTLPEYSHIWHHPLWRYHWLTDLMGSARYQSSQNCSRLHKLEKNKQKSLNHVEGFYLLHSAVVIELPVEVEIFNANTAGIGARQSNCAPIHCLKEGNFPDRHLKGLSRPRTWKAEEWQKTWR